MSDRELELFRKAKGGDSNAMDVLLNSYKGLASTIARKYHLMGGDTEELLQEGMIGLYRAIYSYDPEKNSSFKAYAGRVIENKIIDAIRHATSKSNQILTDSVFVDDDDSILSDDPTPETNYISAENTSELLKEIEGKLGRFEKQVMHYYISGFSYGDIAEKLGKSTKSIDNALSRIRKKLEYLKERL